MSHLRREEPVSFASASLKHIGHLLLNWSDRFLAAVFFVRNQIACEDFQHAFSGANNWSDIKPNVNDTGDDALPLDLVTGESKSEYRPDNGNRFNYSLSETPPASSQNSSFDCTHR